MSDFWEKVRRIAKSYWYDYTEKKTDDELEEEWEEEFEEDEEEQDEEMELRRMIEDISRAQDARHVHFSEYEQRNARRNSPPSSSQPEKKIGMTLPKAFAALGILPSSNDEDIKSAYKKLMLMYHPDKTSTLQPELQKEAHAKAREINIAYQFLRNAKGF